MMTENTIALTEIRGISYRCTSQVKIQHFRSPVGNIMFSLVRRDIERGIALRLRILLTEAAIPEADDRVRSGTSFDHCN